MVPITFGNGGMFLISVLLPIVASLIVDGVVVVVRKKKVAPLIVAVIFTGLVAFVGQWAWSTALLSDVAPATLASGLASTSNILLPLTIVLALIALAVRQRSALRAARKRRRIIAG